MNAKLYSKPPKVGRNTNYPWQHGTRFHFDFNVSVEPFVEGEKVHHWFEVYGAVDFPSVIEAPLLAQRMQEVQNFLAPYLKAKTYKDLGLEGEIIYSLGEDTTIRLYVRCIRENFTSKARWDQELDRIKQESLKLLKLDTPARS